MDRKVVGSMRAPAHLVGGFIAGALVPGPGTPALVVGALLGALLPDIDHPGSTLGRRTRPVSNIVSGAFGHRGWTHTWAALIVAGLVAMVLGGGAFAAGLAAGYLSHLVLDGLG